MLQRLLFWLTIAAAAALLGLYLLAPGLAGDDPHRAARWLGLFAWDLTVRRTALACSAGLFVTAVVFFRHHAAADAPRAEPREAPPVKSGRPGNSIGA